MVLTTNVQICSIYECVDVEVDDVVDYHVDDTCTIDGQTLHHLGCPLIILFMGMYACTGWMDGLIDS